MKLIDTNKKAYFDYFIEDTFEAGLALLGSEVKSVKSGNVNLKDSFCFLDGGEIFLKNCRVAPYEKGSVFNADPVRDRKLLLKRAEIDKIAGKIRVKGYTLVVTKIYLSGRLVKVEVALAKGKQSHDKREAIKEKDIKRDTERQIRGET